MFEKLEVFQMAGAMAKHAAARQALIAENIAQADTPGYKARDIAPFSETYRSSNESPPMRATRRGHIAQAGAAMPVAISETAGAGSESPNGNSVSLETEMMKSAVVRQEHDMALAIYKSALGILRSSLGRR